MPNPIETPEVSVWKTILRWFSKKARTRKKALDLGLYPRKQLAAEYMRHENIKTSEDIIKAINKLEKMPEEEIYNVKRGILINELQKEYFSRQMGK